MSYYRFGQSYRSQKPRKKGFFSLSKRKNKRVTHYNEAALELANPFKRTHKAKARSLNLKAIILPALFAIWIGLMLYLPYFEINKITYSGLKVIKQQELEMALQEKFFSGSFWYPATNYFIVNDGNIAQFLQDKYSLNSITVTKNFPNSLVIAVEEKNSSAIYDNGHAYYLIGEDGAIIKQLRDVKQSEFAFSTTTEVTVIKNSTSTMEKNKISSAAITYVTSTTSTIKTVKTHVPAFGEMLRDFGSFPLIYNENNTENSLTDKHVLPKTTVEGILSFYNAVKRGRVANITYMTYKDVGGSITAYTTNPWKIIFEPETDIGTQISNLQIILKNNHPTEYIDIRFGDRVYWK